MAWALPTVERPMPTITSQRFRGMFRRLSLAVLFISTVSTGPSQPAAAAEVKEQATLPEAAVATDSGSDASAHTGSHSGSSEPKAEL